MTDTATKESPKATSYQLLRRDVRFLGNILGEVLVHLGGRQLLDIVEDIRKTSIALRTSPNPEMLAELKRKIASLAPGMRRQVIRAFAIYFQLVNIAEQNHRLRRKRDYERSAGEGFQPGSIESAVFELKNRGVTADEVEQILNRISLELVMTAHPTEAVRRAILDIHQRIAQDIMALDDPTLTFREREHLREKLLSEVLTLWQTDELRDRKPTVLDEVRNGLYYFDETLFDVLPDVYEELERCLTKYYPERKWHVPSYLKFGSWIGGDRDGNPSVTADVTWQTLVMHRHTILSKYEEALRHLRRLLSFSSTLVDVTKELLASIREDGERLGLKAEDVWRNEKEPYRIKVSYMLEKIRNTADLSKPPSVRYASSRELMRDLQIIDRSLRNHLADYFADKYVRRLIRQVELFGFHLATLDIRQHSKEHEAAMAEILAKMGLATDYASMSEDEKVRLLSSLLEDPRPVTSPFCEYSEATKECLDVFHTVARAHEVFGPESVRSYLISMSQGPSDLLEVLVFAKEAGLYRVDSDGRVHCRLQPVPLFETIEDLHAAPDIMTTVFRIPAYRKSVEAFGDLQEIMIGYSDSNKDGGVVTANWELWTALRTLTDAADEFGIKVKFFHGRGGALGRGGMPLNRSILAQPPETLGGGIKITEQGEVLSQRYSLKGIAYRSLEQATWALVLAGEMARRPRTQLADPAWEEAMRVISEHARKKYQDLVYRDPDFLAFFKESTPLPEIGELNIGSRPVKRKNSDRFEDLRAIPWVFSWTQSRYLFPAWYAAGTGFRAYVGDDPARLEQLRRMYREWPFFRSLIDNLQMALAKADLLIAEEYAGMVRDRRTAERIFGMIREEYELTSRMILDITGQQGILDNVPVLQESIRLRNPYVDPLSHLQVRLLTELRALRERGGDDPELLREVLLTINGIAAGMRNTG